MKSPPQMVRCFSCENEFQFGPYMYLGRHITGYEITVCNICYDANSDGWPPYSGERIITHLQRRGIDPPVLNSSGWIPRDWPV
jgi:hypothetical protein